MTKHLTSTLSLGSASGGVSAWLNAVCAQTGHHEHTSYISQSIHTTADSIGQTIPNLDYGNFIRLLFIKEVPLLLI